MNKQFRRAVAASTALAGAISGLVLAGTTVPAQADHVKRVVTDYGFTGRAFGTVAKIEGAGVSSGRSAFAYLGCTRRAGTHRENFAAENGEPISPALYVGAVTNRTNTYQARGQNGVRATSDLAELRLGMPDGPHILIEGLRTQSNAFATKRGKLRARSSFASVKLTPRTGTPLDDVLDQVDGGINDLIDQVVNGVIEGVDEDADRKLVIPGLGEIALGRTVNIVRARVAKSNAVALRVTLFGPDGVVNGGDDVEVKVGRSRAFIYKDLPSGVMRGSATPVEGQLLGGALKVGRLEHLPLPCNGTDGKVKEEGTARANLFNLDAVEVTGVHARVFGVQRQDGRARAFTESHVAEISLGDGALVLTGIKGRVNVKQNRSGQISARNTRGSVIASITADGEEQGSIGPGEVREFPLGDPENPLTQIVQIETFLKEGGKRGMKVTAVRITILRDQEIESVINLGTARAYITRT